MKYISTTPVFALALILTLTGCGDTSPPADADLLSGTPAETGAAMQVGANDVAVESPACADEPGIHYLCGLINAEDILPLANTPWVLASGMSGELSNDSAINGKLHLINREDYSWEILFPGNAPVMAWNQDLYGQCPGPLDTTHFSAHGMALKALDSGPAQFRLYMTSHGAREAIEVFEIDALVKPTIKWVGCIPMPASSWTNSLVILNDWGFFATQFMDPTGAGMAGVNAREITGQVFEWHPGGEVGTLAGTGLSGANGIEMSGDERYLFVAAFGTQEIVRFDRSSTPVSAERVRIGISPDNIRWSDRGTLYAAGGNRLENCDGAECGGGWSVWELVPFSMSAARLTGMDASVALQGVSTGSQIGDEIWIGTYGGDRLGIIPQP